LILNADDSGDETDGDGGEVKVTPSRWTASAKAAPRFQSQLSSVGAGEEAPNWSPGASSSPRSQSSRADAGGGRGGVHRDAGGTDTHMGLSPKGDSHGQDTCR
jgi:hypothetical protein